MLHAVTGPTSDYVLPEGLDATALRERLDDSLDLAPDGSRVIERAYFDTFDGRVRRAGLALVWEGERLLLEDEAERRLAALDWPKASAVVFAGATVVRKASPGGVSPRASSRRSISCWRLSWPT